MQRCGKLQACWQAALRSVVCTPGLLSWHSAHTLAEPHSLFNPPSLADGEWLDTFITVVDPQLGLTQPVSGLIGEWAAGWCAGRSS